jgi:hypothetical protein
MLYITYTILKYQLLLLIKRCHKKKNGKSYRMGDDMYNQYKELSQINILKTIMIAIDLNRHLRR